MLFFYLFKRICNSYSECDEYWEFYHDVYFCNNVKFNMLAKHRENQKFLDIFCNIQKMVYGFSKLARLYKLKKATIKNIHDLGLNPISHTNPRKTIQLLHDSSIYIITLPELIQIICTALSYVNGFFMLEPYIAKNPYTNVPFNKSTLYNIYFAVKQSDYKMPALFHSFFLHHFNLIEFVLINGSAILDYAITRHVYKSHFDILYNDIIEMLNGHTLTTNLQISKEFPKEELATIMRPYLLTYLRILHSTTCDDAWYHLSDELNILLTNFYIFNPKFGRKYMNTKKRTVTFNKDHINYRPVKNPTLMIVF
jgi:hypothetical protein